MKSYFHVTCPDNKNENVSQVEYILREEKGELFYYLYRLNKYDHWHNMVEFNKDPVISCHWNSFSIVGWKKKKIEVEEVFIAAVDTL